MVAGMVRFFSVAGMVRFFSLFAGLASSARFAGADMVALSLVENSPSGYQLLSVNESTGELAILDGDNQPVHSELAGTGDLCAVDTSLGVWYYLGDTTAGTTLVGLSTADGSEVCSSTITSLAEIGIVGAGQTLDFDDSTENGSLVMSGVSTTNSTQHAVLRLALGDGARRTIEGRKKQPRRDGGSVPGCGAADGTDGADAFEVLGYFGDAAYLPFIHASAIDSAGQRLFVTLQQGDDEVATDVLAVGVVDLVNGESKYYSIAMDSALHLLYGIDYDRREDRLVGVVVNEANSGLNLRSLKLGSSGDGSDAAWSELPLDGAPPEWRYLGGNAGTVSCLDEENRVLFFEAGDPAPIGMFLAAVNIDTAATVAHRFYGDVPISSTGLTMLSHF
jgi:hypothetical protein